MPEEQKSPSAEEINEWLQKVDWDAFWDKVAKNCEKDIEAYHRASAASYAKAHEHWFL